MSMGTLEEFLTSKRRSGQDAATEALQWLHRKDKWLGELRNLYSKLESFLKPLIEKNDIRIETEVTSISEVEIGVYEAPRLIMKLADQRVEFVPRGTNVIAGFGRVDVVGKNGAVSIVMRVWGTWEWYQLDRTGGIPKPVYMPLTEESVQQVLFDLIR